MVILGVILLVLALAAFVAAAFLARRTQASWGTLVAAGLALWVLVQLLAALPGAH